MSSASQTTELYLLQVLVFARLFQQKGNGRGKNREREREREREEGGRQIREILEDLSRGIRKLDLHINVQPKGCHKLLR